MTLANKGAILFGLFVTLAQESKYEELSLQRSCTAVPSIIHEFKITSTFLKRGSVTVPARTHVQHNLRVNQSLSETSGQIEGPPKLNLGLV